MKKIFVLLMSALMIISCLASCGGNSDLPKVGEGASENEDGKTGVNIWDDAKYRGDATLGEGAKTAVVEVSAEEKTVRFTVNTDKATVGEALTSIDLISGEKAEYGLYIKTVNGMSADYNKDKSYWGVYVNGVYSMDGVDSIEFKSGDTYRFVYVKE